MRPPSREAFGNESMIPYFDMQQFIAKIGKGQKASKDLTWEEAKQAMRLLVEGKASQAQVGAFLLAMRIKMESVTELAAFTAVAREYVPPLSVPASLPLVDLPTYAGKQDTFHGLVGAALVAAAGGAAILMHGADTVPGRPGVAPVLGALGIPVDLDSKRAADMVATKGFAYLDLALYHPPVSRYLDMRRELGVRSFFHPVAKMLNPARAKSQVIGTSHPPYLEKTAEALGMLGSARALVVRGVEGDPELSIASVTKLVELRDNRIVPLTLQAKDFGLAPGGFRDMAATQQEPTLLKRILGNEVRGGPRDWVVLNAALLLYVAGRAPSISAGVPLAQQSLDSGAALKKLAELTARPETGPKKKESVA